MRKLTAGGGGRALRGLGKVMGHTEQRGSAGAAPGK